MAWRVVWHDFAPISPHSARRANFRWHSGQVFPAWVDEPHPATGHLPVQRAATTPQAARDQDPVEVPRPGADGIDHAPLAGSTTWNRSTGA